MSNRQTISHCSGISRISMYIALGILSVSLFISGFAFAEVTCRSVLQLHEIDRVELDATIENLARLKLNIDQSLVNKDKSSPMLNRARLDYDLKLKELEFLSSKLMSKEDLHKAIRKEVKSQQGERKRDAVEEAQKRAEAVRKVEPEIQIFTPPQYTLVSSNKLNDSFPQSPAELTYIPALKGALKFHYNSGGKPQLLLVDIHTQKETVYKESPGSFRISNDRTKMFERNGNIITITDFTDPRAGDSMSVGTSAQPLGLLVDVSPSGEYMSFINKYQSGDFLQIVDVRAGKIISEIKLTGRVQYSSSKDILLRFLDDARIIAENSDREVFSIDFVNSSENIYLPSKVSAHSRGVLSEDRRSLFLVGLEDSKTSANIQVVDIINEKNVSISKLPEGLEYPMVTVIPQHPNHIAIRDFTNNVTHASVIDRTNGKVVFDFDGKYNGSPLSGARVQQMDFAPDGTVLVISTGLDQNGKLEARLDVWRKD